VITKKCRHCDGIGVVRSRSEYNVKLPAGIDDGQSIKLSGKGGYAGPGSNCGDLYVVVHVKEDNRFARDGFDIYTTEKIKYPQAVFGDKIKILTVDGEKTLVVPSGTQSHQEFRLKGFGVPHINSSGRGDQYVKIVVDVPKKISRNAKKLIEELGVEL
jgi:molecular chaperone DnaJ